MARPVFLLFGLLISSVLLAGEPSQEGVRTYDQNPSHLWNRLHQTLFIRVAADGTSYGHDRIDPLFWGTTKHLLEEPSHREALKVLDEFLSKDGDKLVRDPLRRAFLQHDLWALFGWSAAPYATKYQRERAELQIRLAQIVRRLALSGEDLRSLSDNYAGAVAADTPASLPRGLFLTDGDWINVSVNFGTAPSHTLNFGGRSTFHVLVRLPEGRAATLAYIERLNSFERPYIPVESPAPFDVAIVMNPAMPQFPPGTQWALVRRMRIIDSDRRIRPTPVIESIQVRRYGVLQEAQQVFEFLASRAARGELREVQRGERDFYQFQAHDTDAFELSAEELARFRGPDPFRNQLQRDVLRSCSTCHSAAGIQSVQSLARLTHDRTLSAPKLSESDPGQVLSEVVSLASYQWGLLHGLWDRPGRP